MSGERIVKNTLVLYFRMLCVMGVSLYTVRVTLVALGAHDYGIYQAVGGIVMMLAFINSALGAGTARFLTYELGTGDGERLRALFSTLLLAHIAIALAVIVVAEPIGIYYVSEYLAGSTAALVVFELSVVTAAMNMTQIPYTAVLIAHERLGIYAYVTLAEVGLKLAVAFAIMVVPTDKLIWYAALTCLVQLVIMGLYRYYCVRSYAEARFSRGLFSLELLRPVGAFSFWSIFAQCSLALLNQGTLLMLNTFFSPTVVAARSIALQVSNAAGMFLNNFRTAANPQIVKRLAAGDARGSEQLCLQSTYFSYYLMLMVALPVMLLAEPLLSLWLVEVPEYAVEFLIWSMVQSLIAVFDSSLYTALYAKGELRENAICSPTVGFIIVPVQLGLFYLGYSPLVVAYLGVVTFALLGLVIKPYLAWRVAGYSPRAMLAMYARAARVSIVAVPVVLATCSGLDGHTLLGFTAVCVLSVAIVAATAWTIGMDSSERTLARGLIARRVFSSGG